MSARFLLRKVEPTTKGSFDRMDRSEIEWCFSNQGADMEPSLLEALRRCAAFLDRRDIKYVIVGGLANAVWGEPRTTRDIDFKVHIGRRTAVEFEALIASEFRLIPRAPGVSPFVVSAEIYQSISADFLIAVPGYEEMMMGRALSIDFGEMSLPVCSPEDLILQKIIADRSKDWADVEGILVEQRSRLDSDYIRQWLTEFATILERPDWLSRYSSLVRELAEE